MNEAQHPDRLPPDLLARIAHSLRSPLGIVASAMDELRAELAANHTAEHGVLWSLAERARTRIVRIADRLDLVACLQAGQLRLVIRRCDLVQIVRDAVAMSQAAEQHPRVQLTRALPESAVEVEVDPERVMITLAELVDNALRHARTCVFVGLERHAHDVSIVIEDDGNGLRPDRRDATCPTAAYPPGSRSGLGLGLIIAGALIHAHGGKWVIESMRDSRGTRCTVVLPIQHPPPDRKC